MDTTLFSRAGALFFAVSVQAATPVFVSEVQAREFVDEVEALGSLRADESVTITANVTEWVTRVNFDDGERVRAGDVLVEMERAEEEAQLAEEQSRLAEARQQFDRTRQLTDDGALAPSELDARRRDVEVSEARIAALESRLAQRRITAPFDGVTGLRDISPGALVQPGTVITTLDADSTMKLDFAIPSVFLAVLEPGMRIEARSRAYDGEIFAGTVRSVDSRIDPATRSVQVRALLPNGDRRLRPGLLMSVRLQKNARESLAVPEEAITFEGNRRYVWVVEGEGAQTQATRRDVETGTRRGGAVEIRGGLKAGEQVVMHGGLKLSEGASVEIAGLGEPGMTLAQLLSSRPAAEEGAL
ncbi:MAG: efflux RND transporter periplasmic adaptor subunit [Verrucomicrobiota bacterium]